MSNAFGGGGGGLFGGGSSNGILPGDQPSFGFGDIWKIFGFGRASGGFVAPGQTVRVNEHRGGVEGFRPTGSGTIIPIGQMNAMAARGSEGQGTVRVIIEEGPNFLSTIRTEATGVSLEVTRASAPAIVEAASNETIRRANRPRMPGAGR